MIRRPRSSSGYPFSGRLSIAHAEGMALHAYLSVEAGVLASPPENRDETSAAFRSPPCGLT